MNHSGKPSWEQALVWLAVGAVSLQVVADVLPHVLVPLVVLAGAGGALRLIWFLTDRRL